MIKTFKKVCMYKLPKYANFKIIMDYKNSKEM